MTWYKEANERYQRLQAKMTKTLDDKAMREKEEVIEELKDEIKKLDDSNGLSLRSFIDFLFEHFPPQHRKKVIKPTVMTGKEKQTCIKLSALYHPDKVKDEHGQKYKVLCEEIVKRINNRLTAYKGVD